ncbi:hypothetical protein [Alkalicoccobacillus porphyridii]|uniref:DinB family protein n=1 Tax=Alkalicoccobacillus porphyridii TaxID=2597270 RepID=A0A554A216_9BACI|nr:hypothetical protein [Alkalicoccobacillus porphyridii]TSB47741.1 hypothetical protein FN960_04285 [Alkalicoccobacillus porphyridii]
MKEEIKELLNETFNGPDGTRSWYTETKKGSGLLGTIEGISAGDASTNLRGTTIAAHTHHTMYHITVCKNAIKKIDVKSDWGISWKIKDVSEDEWNEIKKGLEDEYKEFVDLIDQSELSSVTLRMILANLAHSAYHLGAIRQLVKEL